MRAIRRAAMNGTTIHPMKEERGIVLIVSMLVLTVLSVLGLAFLTTARTEDTIAANYRNHTAAFYAAEAGVESGVASLKALLATTPVPTDKQLTDILAPALTDPNYTFGAFQVTRVRTAQPYSYTSSIASGPFSGLLAARTDYVVTAQVTGPRGSRAQVSQTIQYMQIPLFQFAVFYGRGVDLEITPAPPMVIKGRVHANSNIHMYGGTSLRIESPVTTSGHMYRDIKSDPNKKKYNPEIKAADGTFKLLDFDYEVKNITYDGSTNTWDKSDAAYWKNTALSRFGGTVMDGDMGIKDLNLPLPELLTTPANPDVISHQIIEKGLPGDSDALKDAKLYYQADLRIVNGVATLKDGSAATLDPGVTTTKKFWDNRDKRYITVTEVDVKRLDGNLKTLFPTTPFNGILYVSNDASDTGVRLVNGEKLPSTGLSLVSEKPVYIQGDYNTKDKVPASVLADAITVLSNNWKPNNFDSDAKAKGKISDRPAKDTTVNAAFMLGPASESVLGTGNGQLENVIRFLEDWDGKTINYNGSIASLWHSQHAQGQWGCCGSQPWHYYKPPNRNWSFDTTFLTNPPPGTPMAIEIMRSRWSQM